MLSLRDTFRVIHPLYAITAPTAQAEVIRTLIDIYRHTGFLLDCRMSLDKGFTPGGSNADSLLADSFVKGITAGIDWQTGFAAMLKDAQVEGDWEVEGRGGIASHDKYGYIPVGDYEDEPPSNAGHTRHVSRRPCFRLKFDLRIDSLVGVPPACWNMHTTTSASLSSRRGSTAPRTRRTSSINQATGSTLWNFNASNTGFAGFIQPRNADGSWFFDSTFDRNGVFRPDHCSPVFGHLDCFFGAC
jgi:putative alpha-1,2-mannosidase